MNKNDEQEKKMGEVDEKKQPPRLILHQFLSPEECKELEFIHKSSSTVGYRPNVFSTSLSHLIATNSPHFLLPFVPIRERLKDKVEHFFGCEFQLCVEFTGLISWCRGASIGWHSDDNRPYLKQRHFTAVCYLNSHGKDFKGGLLHFQNGDPATIVPLAGDVAIYTADTRNTHSVDEIIQGERLTLTLWFTRNGDHDEDSKLVSLLTKEMLHGSIHVPRPLSASNNMYWFSPDAMFHQQSGFDIRCARMHLLGFEIYSSLEKSLGLDFSDLLMEPLQLAKGNELYELEFTSILHALQVVQFYCWKASELLNSQYEVETSKVVSLSESQRERIRSLQSLFIKDQQLPELIFGYLSCNENRQHMFDWVNFSTAIAGFEDYTHKLYKKLQMSLPYWRTHAIIYSVSSEGSLHST